jgi:hypothetical protein
MVLKHTIVSSETSRSPAAPRLGVFCEEKIFLMANYGAAATKYCAAVAELEQTMIRDSKEVYAQRRRTVEVARIISEAALKELDDHVAAHGC